MKNVILKSFLSASMFFAVIQANSQNNTFKFDGSDDYAVASHHADFNFNLNNSFTIEGWINTSLGWNHSIVFSKLENSTTFKGYDVTIQGTKLTFCLINNYPSNCIKISGSSSVTDGNWHHFACVYRGVPNAANISLYVDGVLETNNVIYNTLTGSITHTGSVYIGTRHDLTYFFDGEIDDIRVWNRALCAAEIVARKNCHLNGTETNLVAYYNFNQGTGGGNNSAFGTLNDASAGAHSAALMNIALSGSTSNYVNASNGVTGTCAPFGNMAVSGNTLMCAGSSQTLVASGASTYTWSTGSQGAAVVVSPTVTTTYSVSGFTNNNCLVEAVYTQSVAVCTGINELAGDFNVLLYPNPACEKLLVKGLQVGSSIEVYNSQGLLASRLIISQTQAEMNVADLPSGIYLIKVKSNGSEQYKKFVISR